MRNEIVNRNLVPVYGLIGILALLIVKVYNTAFKGGKFTCNRYILNTYLYILLALVIISLQNIVMEQQNVPVEKIFGPFRGLAGVILLFVITIGLLFLLLGTDPKNVIFKHLLWLLFVVVLGLLAYPTYLMTIEQNTVVVVLLTTIAILFGFTIVAFVKPEWISLTWGPILACILLAAIIGEICFMFFNRDKKTTGRTKFMSYFFILVFIINFSLGTTFL